MASSVDNVYLWGDDLDLVMRLLNEDEDFNADINAVVEEVGNVLYSYGISVENIFNFIREGSS